MFGGPRRKHCHKNPLFGLNLVASMVQPPHHCPSQPPHHCPSQPPQYHPPPPLPPHSYPPPPPQSYPPPPPQCYPTQPTPPFVNYPAVDNSGICMNQQGGQTWIPTNIHHCNSLLSRAVIAGQECDGTPIYIGRTCYDGDMTPCKVIPRNRMAFVSYNGQEILVHNFELYSSTVPLVWRGCSYGNVPVGAISSGKTKNGEALYIARVHYQGSITPGKVHQSHRCCYIPYNGREIRITDNYEVLAFANY